MQTTLKLNPEDNVAIALRSLEIGEGGAVNRIPRGHKVALCNIGKGEIVRKYAQPIGYASEGIGAGSHVHTHNLGFGQVQQSYEFAQARAGQVIEGTGRTFLGYRRNGGRVGTRNYVAVISSVNCSATAARMMASHFDDDCMAEFPNVDGVAAFVHGTGCGMADDGEGFEALQRVMWGYARHPNVSGVLMVGLGCEINQIEWLVEAYGLKTGPLFQTMNIQERAGLSRTVDLGIRKIKEMLPAANECRRVDCPVSELTVALQCGGSDAWSGVTANPALGNAVDQLVAMGGTGVLAETPEIYGAEHLLTRRALNRDVGERLIDLIRWWEDYAARNRGSINNNPSPGNKQGGLSTILEKSLGAVAKGGTTTLNEVCRYGDRVKGRGLVFMDSPGYDPVSVTGQIASGCNLVAFTTGRGSAFGSKPAPCIKIATNSDMYKRLQADMDINAGPILDGGETVEEMGGKIFEKLIAVASGEQSKSESQGLGDYEFVPWQLGAVM
ncbi:MAG: altronate dehydratase [Rhodobacteraceae bacterium]|nr:altronate dehydratase [Paracoccaceae bacterium]